MILASAPSYSYPIFILLRRHNCVGITGVTSLVTAVCHIPDKSQHVSANLGAGAGGKSRQAHACTCVCRDRHLTCIRLPHFFAQDIHGDALAIIGRTRPLPSDSRTSCQVAFLGRLVVESYASIARCCLPLSLESK